MDDVLVVVSIDFGTTYSGFAYARTVNPEIITNDSWPDQIGQLKTNTALKYDKNFKFVEEWGYPALAKPIKSKGKSKNQFVSEPVERFKLHLSNIPDNEKPVLPKGINYKKAITDYLKCMGELIKETITTRWPNFTTEPEAAAIYCMKLFEHTLNIVGTNFLTVDCGSGTVDLTTRQLLKNDKLGEKTIRACGFCGGVNVDKAAATLRGALEYGLNMKKIKTRRLPLTYGIELAPLWKPGDPPERRQTHNRIFKFRRLVEKGVEVDVDQEFGFELRPSFANQTELLMEIYSTTANEATYCDEPGMKKVGKLKLDFPNPRLGFQRTISFTLTFGQMEIRAYAKNQQGKITNATFVISV
ncbi:unnamed protein product [Rhizophagus irregularis]|uniref:Hsp70 family protein n=1 Tax=Rhizophagus irregularis TaxID=588596 RepID=A0A915YN97_9GLOM|nr:unnamed protein product [Rhizophagus irregularis]